MFLRSVKNKYLHVYEYEIIAHVPKGSARDSRERFVTSPGVNNQHVVFLYFGEILLKI